jgi:hypothetical protein
MATEFFCFVLFCSHSFNCRDEVTYAYERICASTLERGGNRMVSSGMLRRVALVRTDVSEEPSASFIRVTRIGELRTTLAGISNRRTLRRNTLYFFAACVGC